MNLGKLNPIKFSKKQAKVIKINISYIFNLLYWHRAYGVSRTSKIVIFYAKN